MITQTVRTDCRDAEWSGDGLAAAKNTSTCDMTAIFVHRIFLLIELKQPGRVHCDVSVSLQQFVGGEKWRRRNVSDVAFHTCL